LKRITAISLLFLLLASQFGHHVLHSIQEWSIRQDQERRILSNIPEAFLEKFVDSPALTWEEPGKEFQLDGEMYDVVTRRSEHGKTIYYSIADDKEADLLRTFSKALKEDPNSTQTPKGGKQSLKLQIPVFTLPEEPMATEFASFQRYITPATLGRTISRPRSVLPCPPWA